MSEYGIYFIYGLCVMFYFMMTWFFVRKNKELLSRLIALLMCVLGLQCLKDLFFLYDDSGIDTYVWHLMSSTDMIAVPLYAFILVELCRPMSLTLRSMILQELTFIIPIILFSITHNYIFYYITVIWAALYGFGYAGWTIFTIPKYHSLLKQRFSYDENINLNWLRVILGSFAIILSLWIIDCLIVNLDIEALYMGGSLIIWMFICYFIYKHESVIEELTENGSASLSSSAATPDDGQPDMSEIGRRITDLFFKEKIYLNPNLKLSDIAIAIGTNRTYVSTFFNKEAGCTFYDYVNKLRIDHSSVLLRTTRESLNIIAEKSGFNSPQSFIRVFNKYKGISPTKYRSNQEIPDI